MRQIAYIADDFGRSTAINSAIIHAHREGALTGASLMLGQAATDEAVALARANPQLEIGWHLHLCDSQPMTVPTWPWGETPFGAGIELGVSAAARRLTRAEIQSQWRQFQATGLPCQFVNSHHHLHLHPFVLGEVRRTVGDEFTGWLRGFDFRLWGRSNRRGPKVSPGAHSDNAAGAGRGEDSSRPNWGLWATRIAGKLLAHMLARRWSGDRSDTVWGLDRLYRMNAAEILALLPLLPDGRHELVFHVGANVPDLDLRTLLELCGRPSAEGKKT